MAVPAVEGINPVVAQLVVSVVRLSPRPLRCDEVHAALRHTGVSRHVVRQALAAVDGAEVRRFGTDSWTLPAKVPHLPRLNRTSRGPVTSRGGHPDWYLTVVWHVLAGAWAATPTAIARRAAIQGLSARSAQAILEQWRDAVCQELPDGRWRLIRDLEPPIRSPHQDSETAIRWFRGPVPLVELPSRTRERVAQHLSRGVTRSEAVLLRIATPELDISLDHVWLHLAGHPEHYHLEQGRWQLTARGRSLLAEVRPVLLPAPPAPAQRPPSHKRAPVAGAARSASEPSGRERMVYVTGKGRVYHWEDDCPALRVGWGLAIQAGRHKTRLLTVTEARAMRAGRASCTRCAS